MVCSCFIWLLCLMVVCLVALLWGKGRQLQKAWNTEAMPFSGHVYKDLPDELFREIIQYLPLNTAARLSLSSQKRLKTVPNDIRVLRLPSRPRDDASNIEKSWPFVSKLKRLEYLKSGDSEKVQHLIKANPRLQVLKLSRNSYDDVAVDKLNYPRSLIEIQMSGVFLEAEELLLICRSCPNLEVLVAKPPRSPYEYTRRRRRSRDDDENDLDVPANVAVQIPAYLPKLRIFMTTLSEEALLALREVTTFEYLGSSDPNLGKTLVVPENDELRILSAAEMESKINATLAISPKNIGPEFRVPMAVDGTSYYSKRVWCTMLHVAARHLGNENVKQCISMSGANVNAMAYPSKLTPLMLAILHRASDIVDTLLGAGADPSIRADKTINALDAKGVNAFYAAAAKYEPRIFASIFDEELTSRFQRFPGDSKPFQSPCGSVLHGAASRASSGFLELAGPTMLARLGLSMNDVDSLGRTPLHVLCSCVEASAEMATRALDSGANVNAVDASGNTALHYAILRSNGPVVDVLLGRPELAWSSTTVSEAMLNSAAKMGSLVLVNRILHAGQRITTSQCLLNAAEGDYYDIVVALLNARADPNVRGRLNRTPLLFTNSYRVMETLIKHGAKSNIIDSEGYNGVLLTIRRLVNHSQQVDTFNKLKLLISTGAQADCVSTSNESAFSCASIQYASADIIKLLLDNGANPRVASSSKFLQSPLILLAHTTNSVEAIKALIQSYDKEFVRAIQEHSLPVVDYAQRNTHLSEEDRNAVIALLQEYLL